MDEINKNGGGAGLSIASMILGIVSILFSCYVIGLTTLTSSCKKKDMSLKLNKPHNIRGVVSYKRSFPDLNDAHLEVSKKIEFDTNRTYDFELQRNPMDDTHHLFTFQADALD